MTVLRLVSVFICWFFLRLCRLRRRGASGWDARDVLRSAGRGSGRHLVLARPAARALAGDDHSLEEQLATPHAPRLAAFDGTRQALGADRAGPAQRLGELD